MNSPIRIEVPDIPPSGNELRRDYKNHHVYKRLRELWEMWTFVRCPKESRITLAKYMVENGPIKMRVHIHQKRHGELDYDNMVSGCKPVLDSLRRNNYISEDKPKWLESSYTQEKIKKKEQTQTIITLEEVMPSAAMQLHTHEN